MNEEAEKIYVVLKDTADCLYHKAKKVRYPKVKPCELPLELISDQAVATLKAVAIYLSEQNQSSEKSENLPEILPIKRMENAPDITIKKCQRCGTKYWEFVDVFPTCFRHNSTKI